MIKKLIAIGNSHGLVIDKSILELLKITPDSELALSTDGTRLVIEPVGARPRRPGRPRPRLPGLPKLFPSGPRYGFPKKQPW
jgi:hypothetical protein